jgi:hypothetical protein
MDLPPETALARAERRVADGEWLVACQIGLIEALECNNQPDNAALAEGVLEKLQVSLDILYQHLWREQQKAKLQGWPSRLHGCHGKPGGLGGKPAA